MAKETRGRPTVMTSEVVNKLEQAFTMDMTDLEACLYAGISKQTLYNYQDKNKAFIDRKEILKNSLSLKAKTNLANKINDGDSNESRWWLERRRKNEFSTQVNNKNENDGAIEIIVSKKVYNATDND